MKYSLDPEEISRRSFFKTAGGAALGMALSRDALGQQSIASTPKVRCKPLKWVPALTPDNLIDTYRGGFFGTTREQLRRQFVKASGSDHIVVYLHGGLIPAKEGRRRAACHYDALKEANAHQTYFVWRTGALESLVDITSPAARDPLYRSFVSHVNESLRKHSRHGDSCPCPKNPPFCLSDGCTLELADMTSAAAGLEKSMNSDPVLKELARKIVSLVRKLRERREPFYETLGDDSASASVRQDLVLKGAIRSSSYDPAAGDPVKKAVAEELAIAGRGIQEAVAARMRTKRDHCLCATIVEETLRQLKVADLIARTWQGIKQSAFDTFLPNRPDGEVHGGTAFVDELVAWWLKKPSRRVTLMGHSAGSIFICHMLRSIAARHAANDSLLKDFTDSFKFDVVFLAPACTFDLFASTLDVAEGRIRNFRQFGMDDKAELHDTLLHMVPPMRSFYPSSLLYLVSGVAEPDEVDKPIVGMQRYYSGAFPYEPEKFPTVERVKTFIGPRAIWGPTSGPPGHVTKAKHHDDFDHDEETIESLLHIVKNGF